MGTVQKIDLGSTILEDKVYECAHMCKESKSFSILLKLDYCYCYDHYIGNCPRWMEKRIVLNPRFRGDELFYDLKPSAYENRGSGECRGKGRSN